MKLKNLSPLLVLIVIFIIGVPVHGYIDPFSKHEIPIQTGDDHPWGGDSNYGTEDPYIDPPTMAFIWTPLSFIDFFRMIPYLVTRNDLPLIRGNSNQPSGSTTTTITTGNNQSIPNPGPKQRGY